MLEQARAAVRTVAGPAAPIEWGGYGGVFLDLDGHPWEIAHNPGRTLDPKGAVTIR